MVRRCVGCDQRKRAGRAENLDERAVSNKSVSIASRSTDVVLAAVRRVLLCACLASFVDGCASSGGVRPATPQRSEIEMDELRITAARGQAGYQFDAYDAGELFERATALLNQQQCPEATALYDKLVTEFGSSRFASAALYNAGLCLQAIGDFEGSAQRYRRLREAYPDSTDRLDASFQLAEVLVQLERWQSVLELSEELLARAELTAPERLEGMARRSQALLGLGRYDDAERSARSALAFFHGRSPPESIRDEFFAAANNYVVAESLRERQQAMVFPPGVDAQKQVLMRRAELVLEAQREYLNTIGFRNLDNYHWAAAAGYRIGSMYDELWQAVSSAPIPPNLPRAAHAAYHEELGTLITPLIRNAIRYWEATQLSIERAGIKTPWADKIKADLERVRSRLLTGPEAPANRSSADRDAPRHGVVPPADRPAKTPRRSAVQDLSQQPPTGAGQPPPP
jgi:tetratricopeptide (TPR) repeat protein